MRVFQIVMFIIGLSILSTQTFRHVYVKWIEPRDSILDKYDDNIEKNIKSSESIDDLLEQYDEAIKAVKEYEDNPENPKIENSKQKHTEPYITKNKLEWAIKKWESYNRHILKLRFFWFCGFLSLIIGFFIYAKFDRWVGIVGVITGFTEMIFWTFPIVFGVFGLKQEFERLLNNKLIFSFITWILLIITWFLMYKIKGKKRDDNIA